MSETSGEYTSSDGAADGCSVATPDGDCLNETDGYKPTKLQAIRKRSVDPKQGSIIANSLVAIEHAVNLRYWRVLIQIRPKKTYGDRKGITYSVQLTKHLS